MTEAFVMISAVVHTRNEEKNIERALTSLSWVDEIILIDMGSTDATCKIAKSYHAKVFGHPYVGFVEPARNFGIQKAQGEWVMILDADEEVPRTLRDRLKAFADRKEGDYCRIPRKNIIFNDWIRHSGWWPDYQVRFFKKGSVTWSDEIHAIPLTRGTGIDLEICEENSILHHNYQTVGQYIDRLNRYSSIAAKEQYLSNASFSARQTLEKSGNEFINRYFASEGYKDGTHGFALSLLQSFSEAVVYLKLWELGEFQEKKEVLEDVETGIIKQAKLNYYWILTTRLRKHQSSWKRLLTKAKRKLLRYV